MAEPELPSVREWRHALALDEAENGLRWSEDFSDRVRELIDHALLRACVNSPPWIVDQVKTEVANIVAWGSELQYRSASTWDEAREFVSAQGFVSATEYLDWLQAASIALDRWAERNGEWATAMDEGPTVNVDGNHFRDSVNRILLDRRVAFEFSGPKLVRRGDQPLHTELVEPVTNALTSDPAFLAADLAYSEALDHLLTQRAGASITAAGSALQEALRALGSEGGTLGAQVAHAKSKGLLASWDDKLTSAYTLIADWLTSTRSNLGNAHFASRANQAEARLVVHIVGALILRLIEGAESDKTSDDVV